MSASSGVRAVLAGLVLAAAGTAAGAERFDVAVLVGGEERPQYRARGAVYVEAVRGSDYTIRLVNPLPVRIAVALAVDGLNTIDARRTTAWDASKWVLGPYETVEVPGWQVSGREARRFVFTGERSSYGAALGRTEDLGVIEAVVFREEVRRVSSQACSGGADAARGAAEKAQPAPSSERLDEDFAATGIGDRTGHRVRRVRLALEREPVAVVRLRYEFRRQLEALGVLPQVRPPLVRRENASGFERGFCPDPRGGAVPRR